jgi:ATP-dependent DNA ligase
MTLTRICPMLAKKAEDAHLSLEDLLRDDKYIGNDKYNGTGLMVSKIGRQVEMFTARKWKNDVAPRYPEVVAEILEKAGAMDFVAHVEGTFYRKDNGREEMLTILALPETRSEYNMVFWFHDLLKIDDTDVSKLGYMHRWNLLRGLIEDGRYIKIAPVYVGHEEKQVAWQRIMKLGREGMVFKLKDAPYHFGNEKGTERSTDCIKMKRMYQEEKREEADCVVLGLTKGEGRRIPTFGSLLLGQYNKQTGALFYVGKCTIGNDKERKRMFEKFKKICKVSASLDEPLKIINASDIPKSEVLLYCLPKIAVEVYFQERPGLAFYSPQYSRERDDKNPQECYIGD